MMMQSHGILFQLTEASVLVGHVTRRPQDPSRNGNKSRSRADGVAGGLKQCSNQQNRGAPFGCNPIDAIR